MSANGIGGVEISERGFTLWHSDDRGGRWTFRIGWRSGLADVHRSEADGSKVTLWVARTAELVGWADRVVTVDAVGSWVGQLTDAVSWEWIRERGVWLAPMPTRTEVETERLAAVIASHSMEEAHPSSPRWCPPPLDLLPSPLAPGAYVAYPAPKSDDEGIGVLFWTPSQQGRELLWLDAEGVAKRGNGCSLRTAPSCGRWIGPKCGPISPGSLTSCGIGARSLSVLTVPPPLVRRSPAAPRHGRLRPHRGGC